MAAEASGRLFRGLVFFLSREVPREALTFVIRSCGGEARTHTRARRTRSHPVVLRSHCCCSAE